MNDHELIGSQIFIDLEKRRKHSAALMILRAFYKVVVKFYEHYKFLEA